MDGWIWNARVTSIGKESGQLSLEDAAAISTSSSLSVLEELETMVAAMVGLATCSMNSSRLGESLRGSGSEAITADIESIPFLIGKRSEVTLGAGEGERDLGVLE